MSSRHPATVNLALGEFSRHGGETGPHADGWGIAYLNGGRVQMFREPRPASQSAWLTELRGRALRADTVVSHLRLATLGGTVLANTQPFARDLGGRTHVFAHNGDLEGFLAALPDESGACRPLGETDSEWAFCHLLGRLAPLWSGDSPPSAGARLGVLAAFAERLRPLGPANFVYTDGELLVAHAHRRSQADGVIRAPGLHLLHRECDNRDPALHTAPGEPTPDLRTQEATLLASVPLSAELWEPLGEGELVAVLAGRVVARLMPGDQPSSSVTARS